jgi:branched-chain amino acid transport system permease protein
LLSATALAVLIACAFAAPLVLAPYPLTLLSLVWIAALLASSVNLLVGQIGLLSLGQAGISAAAGYAIAWGAVRDADPLVQVGLAVVVTLVVSVVYGVMTMRTNGIVFLMITLAMGMIVFGLAQKMTSLTGGQNGLTGVRRPAFFAEPGAFYELTLLALLVGLVASLVITRSQFGLVLRGVRESEGRMSSLGYPVARVKFLVMVCAGLFAGCAGMLAAWQAEFMSPTTAGFARSAFAVVMVIVGGTGTLLGPVVGAGIVVGIEHWLSSYVERWPTLMGVVLIVVVLFARGGVVGAVQDLVRRMRPGVGGGDSPPAIGDPASGNEVVTVSGTGADVAPAGESNEEVRG